MDSWVLQPIANPIIIALALLAVVLLLLLVKSFGKLTPSRRRMLIVIRMAVIAMAALAMLRPGCVQKIKKNQSAVLLLLLDITRSMELPHYSDQSTRWGTLKDAINGNQSLFQKLLDNKIEVRFFGFDNQVVGYEVKDGAIQFPELPEGGETDIGTAVYRTSQDVRDERLIGVILLSDGVQNALDPEIELTRAAETLQDMEVPLYSVPFGLSGATDQVKDVAVKNLMEQHSVAVKNRLTVKATVVARSFANQPLNVQLLVTDKDGKESPVGAPVIVRPTKAYEEIQVEMDYIPPEVGEFRMKVRVQPQPGEVALRNNELPSFLTVTEGGMRVLYLEGNLGWEQMELKRAIDSAAQGIEVEFLPILPHTRDQWPIAGLADKFRDPAVDVIIIGDLDSSAWYNAQTQTENMEALIEAVEGGKGLLMLGGYHSFGPGSYQNTPLVDVLPILMDPNERQEFGQNVRRDLHIDRRLGLRPVGQHYVTRLSGDEDSSTIWAKLPKLLGANRFVGTKRFATVLLESDDTARSPILVAGNIGGRILCFAGDSTWRWKWQDHEAEFNAFWRQVVFWLAFWDGKNDDSVWINIPQRRFQPRSIVTFTTGARTMVGEEISNADFEITLIAPDLTSTPLNINRTIEGNKVKIDTALVAQSGLYKIQVRGSKDGIELGLAEREFIVFDRDKEKANPAADPEQMLRLANQTQEFGGRSVAPEDLGELLTNILENPPETMIEVPTKWRLGESFTDATIYLLVFVALLATEWTLRKKWGLV